MYTRGQCETLGNKKAVIPEGNVLIDTGFNHDQCRNAMEQALAALRVNMERTDLFITHMHADHSGLIRTLATPRTQILMSHADGHMCLFEPERGMLFSGDHILGRITPNITLSSPDHDVLAQYLASLDKVVSILTGRTLSTVQVTSEMRWSLTYRSWLDYPLAQKMFSTGEAFAHLYHLVAMGKASMALGKRRLSFFARVTKPRHAYRYTRRSRTM